MIAHHIVRLNARSIYIHFAHKPGTLGRFAALLAGLPYGLSAHAKDIWCTPDRELAAKVRDARVVLTCTEEGRSRLEELASSRRRVALSATPRTEQAPTTLHSMVEPLPRGVEMRPFWGREWTFRGGSPCQ